MVLLPWLYLNQESASSAFCSFSPSKRGVIKYRVYVGKLGKSVPRQQEASGNHPSTHSVALGHVFLGREICQWCCKCAPLFRFEGHGEMGWLRQFSFSPGVWRI